MKMFKRCSILLVTIICCLLTLLPFHSEADDASACYGDMNFDGDVDGSDLAEWIALYGGQSGDMETFAANFAREDCSVILPPVTVSYSGNAVTVDNPLADMGVAIDVADAKVTVTSTAGATGVTGITYILSGTTSDGMFKIYSDGDFSLQLSGVDIINTDGPAINIQADETISVELVEGTTNRLTDGETYADAPDDEDQKAAFFSEGQMLFSGSGSLIINGLGEDQHGLGSDDYILINGGSIEIASSAKDGIHTNEGYYQAGGTVDVMNPGSDGIDAGDGPVQISGGDITVLIEDDDRDGIKCDGELLISGGTVALTVTGDQSKGLNAADVLLTGGTVTINTSGGVALEKSDLGYDPSYCTAIKADTQVRLDGAQLTVTTTGAAGRGISSKGDILIYSGQMSIFSTGNGDTYTNELGVLDAYHGPCMKADGNVVIDGGTVALNHSGRGGRGMSVDENLSIGTSASSPTITVTTSGQEISIGWDDATEAKAIKVDKMITITNGQITISSADDGIKAESSIQIDGGRIDITESYEGIEAPNITINGGEIRITSSDDGINATYGDDVEGDDGSMLTINGGYIALIAENGDCIDSNGRLTIEGGTVLVHGPSGGVEVGIDVNGDVLINGGFVVIAQVASNMVETPSQYSGQNSVLLTCNTQSTRGPGGPQPPTTGLTAGTLFHMEDTDQNTLVTFAPEHNYSSVLFSSPDLTNNTTYQVYTGGTCTGGLETDGLYTGGTYSGGTLRTSFTSNETVKTVNF